jgi:hypothetical protein
MNSWKPKFVRKHFKNKYRNNEAYIYEAARKRTKDTDNFLVSRAMNKHPKLNAQ